MRDASVQRAHRRTGDLRASARVGQYPDAEEAAVTFDADYAVYQHEDMDYHHDIGGPKFLETAMVSERNEVARRMQAQVRKALES